jgi:hypothetical protein
MELAFTIAAAIFGLLYAIYFLLVAIDAITKKK